MGNGRWEMSGGQWDVGHGDRKTIEHWGHTQATSPFPPPITKLGEPYFRQNTIKVFRVRFQWMAFRCNDADRHKLRASRKQRRTDGLTDQPTDRQSGL